MAPKLLLVEDNVDYAYLVGRMVRDSWGDASPHLATCVADALEMLRERSYDCVLLDLGLPDGHGMDALDAVLGAAQEVPVVVLTSGGGGDDGQEALRHGAQDYLLKEQVKAAELHRSVGYAIERSAAADAARRSADRVQLLLAGISDVIVVLGFDGRVQYISPSVERVLGYRVQDIDRSVRSRMVHPDDVDLVKARIRDLLDGLAFDLPVQLRLRHADGTWRVVEAVASTTLDDPDLRGIVVTLHDVTDRERAQQEIAARVAQQAMLAALGQDALHDLVTANLLQQAVDGVAATLGIDYAIALRREPEEDALFPCAAAGFVPDAVGMVRVPTGRTSQCGFTLEVGEPVVVQDLDREERFDTALRVAGVEVSSCVTVVIGGRERPFGVFVAASRLPRRFSTDDVHFVQSVANLLAVAVDRRRSEDDIRHRAMHDALTGLPNRTVLADRMAAALAEVGRSGGEMAVLLMDLDRFKEINDTLGHDVGDRVLCEVGTRLAEVVRTTDTVVRLGGDEFAVLCTHLTSDEAVRVAAKVLDALRAPCRLDGMALDVQGSLGLAFAPRHGIDAKTLLKRADAAMYRAKRARTGLSIYTPDVDEAGRFPSIDSLDVRKPTVDAQRRSAATP